MKKFLKELFFSEIISQKCSFVTLFKTVLRNFDSSINVAVVNGGYLRYTDMKILKKSSDFEIISKKCSLGDPFQKLFSKF